MTMFLHQDNYSCKCHRSFYHSSQFILQKLRFKSSALLFYVVLWDIKLNFFYFYWLCYRLNQEEPTNKNYTFNFTCNPNRERLQRSCKSKFPIRFSHCLYLFFKQKNFLYKKITKQFFFFKNASKFLFESERNTIKQDWS